MISAKEYELLKSLKQSPVIDRECYANEIKSLLNQEKIYYNITGSTRHSILYDGFVVTPAGDIAIEEYERMLEKQRREEETLDAAREANEIANKSNTLAEQANATANEANKISSKSNLLSKIAICISVASVIATLIVGFCV